jgi:hypothetical protein
LARIQKFTSHTFHVFIKDLVPGAKAGRSLLFTRIVEHQNQYLAKNRSTPTSKPYSALDTLTFIQAHFVQENENAVHISWTAILLHTRELLQPLYQWQASFDPLTRKYEQAKTKDLTKTEYRNIDKGIFKLRDFQDKLAANASRFQSKKYTPDSRMLTYLKVRAQEFNVPVPSFMKKRLPDKGKGSQPSKRGRSNMQQNRVRYHQAYLQQPIPSGASVPTTTSTASTFVSAKGKGKGKSALKGQRVDTSKGKGNFFQKGASHSKGKGSSKGKSYKGSPKGNRTHSGGSTVNALIFSTNAKILALCLVVLSSVLYLKVKSIPSKSSIKVARKATKPLILQSLSSKRYSRLWWHTIDLQSWNSTLTHRVRVCRS